MSYLGNTPTTQSFISGTDYFNGTGAQTAFTLSRTVASVNDIQAVVNNVVQVPNDAYTISGTTITFTSAPSAGTNNVYVRYLSTTTQAITPSQNTVSWSTLDTNTQQDLGISGKNRIINGNMVIDQRNAGASVSNDGYAVDRFNSFRDGSTVAITSQQSTTAPAGFVNSMVVTTATSGTAGSGEGVGFQQRIEGLNISDLGWGTANAKTVTLSFWVRSSLTGTFGGALSNSAFNRSYPYTFSISSANTFEYKTITIPGDTSGTWLTTNGIGIRVYWDMGSGTSLKGTAGAWAGSGYVGATGATNLVGTNGATFYITGVQLEVGTQATTFTLAGGSYGAELLLCQRYYEVAASTNVYTSVVASIFNTTDAYSRIDFKVPKRTTPSITVGTFSDWSFYSAGAGRTMTGVVPQNACNTGFQMKWLATGLTSGYAGHVDYNPAVTAANGGGWAVSAEL
jgi:hypothetical protein